MCVGATSGIGRAVAVRMAQLQANVTVFGRNPQLGGELMKDLEKANPEGEHSFIMVNASLMKSVVGACDNYLTANPEKPLHYLIMTPGKEYHMFYRVIIYGVYVFITMYDMIPRCCINGRENRDD